MNTQNFMAEVQKARLNQQLQDSIDFAKEFMQARTYRQIVQKVRNLLPKVLGFDYISVFFKN